MNRTTAGLVAGGTFLCVVALPLLLASVYAAVSELFVTVAGFEPDDGGSSVNEVLAWCGWIALGTGALMLSAGIYRLLTRPCTAITADPLGGTASAPADGGTVQP